MILNFGKYTGKTLEEIAKTDRQYLDFIYRAFDLKKEHKKAIKEVLDNTSTTDNEYGQEDIILDSTEHKHIRLPNWNPPVENTIIENCDNEKNKCREILRNIR